MKVGQLIDLLEKFNPEAVVVIHRDNFNYGFGYIENVRTGIFRETEYGNDFHPDTELIMNPAEIKAVCLYPEDYETLTLEKQAGNQ